MRILLTFIAFLPSIIATPAFPDSHVAESGTKGITAPKNNFKPFGDKPFGDQPFGDKPFGDKPFGDKPFGDKPFGDQPFGDKPWDYEESDPLISPTDPIYLPPPKDSGDAGIYAPPTEPWGCPPDRPIPLCCDGKSYGDDVETGCSAWDGKLTKCNIMLDQFCCGHHYKLVGVGQHCKNIFDLRVTSSRDPYPGWFL